MKKIILLSLVILGCGKENIEPKIVEVKPKIEIVDTLTFVCTSNINLIFKINDSLIFSGDNKFNYTYLIKQNESIDVYMWGINPRINLMKNGYYANSYDNSREIKFNYKN
jgi:hypothetical protein